MHVTCMLYMSPSHTLAETRIGLRSNHVHAHACTHIEVVEEDFGQSVSEVSRTQDRLYHNNTMILRVHHEIPATKNIYQSSSHTPPSHHLRLPPHSTSLTQPKTPPSYITPHPTFIYHSSSLTPHQHTYSQNIHPSYSHLR